jgi:hypothetical protein
MLESARQRQAETKQHAKEREREDDIMKYWHWYTDWILRDYLAYVPGKRTDELRALLQGVEDEDERILIAYNFDGPSIGRWAKRPFWEDAHSQDEQSQDE